MTITWMETIKNILRVIWTITDNGPAEWFINLRLSDDRRSDIMKIDQSSYVKAKSRAFGLQNDTGSMLPMPPLVRLSKSMVPDEDEDGKEALTKVQYRSITGSSNYFRLT